VNAERCRVIYRFRGNSASSLGLLYTGYVEGMVAEKLQDLMDPVRWYVPCSMKRMRDGEKSQHFCGFMRKFNFKNYCFLYRLNLSYRCSCM